MTTPESSDPLWRRLADEISDGARRDLSPTIRTRGQPPVRTRGTIPARPGQDDLGAPPPADVTPTDQRPDQVEPSAYVVVVEVPSGAAARPTDTEIRRRLSEAGLKPIQDPDVYYLTSGKHWAALDSRELNPADPEHGAHHDRILRNLRPDVAIMTTPGDRPAWSGPATTVVRG